MTEPQLVCPCGTPHGHTPSALTTNATKWQGIRRNILTRDSETCQVCGAPAPIHGRAGVRSGHCGHVLARELGGCDSARNLRAECASCSTTDGARIGNDQRRTAKIASAIASGVQHTGPVSLGGTPQQDPASFNASLSGPAAGEVDTTLLRTAGPDDSCWDAAPWLADLRVVPENAVWPRLMTAPHPEAVGTYGPELVEQFRTRTGMEMRWWQQLTAYRVLEHREDGTLVWTSYLLTLARQVGKSWLLRELMLWRMQQVERWGTQLVLHTGRDLTIVLEVLRPAQAWAEEHGLFASRDNGKPGISTAKHMGGSRWLAKAKDRVYGYSPGGTVVDEAWDVPAHTVDEGLWPTMIEQTSPQMGLISTAHRKATGLMLDRRAAAIASIRVPKRALLIEWSATSDLDRADPATWREASPHWSPQRQELIEEAWEKAQRGETDDPNEPDPIAAFDAQWLDRWPVRRGVLVELPGELLLAEGAWEALQDADAAPVGPLHIGVEDNLGRGAAAACAGLTVDGRVVVGGWEFPSRAEAFQWARGWYEAVPGSRLVVGASLESDLEVQELAIPVDTAGRAETPGTLALFRTLVAAGGIAHDGGEDLARHVDTARVRANTDASALQLVSPDRSDLLRVASWVSARADRDRGSRVAIH